MTALKTFPSSCSDFLAPVVPPGLQHGTKKVSFRSGTCPGRVTGRGFFLLPGECGCTAIRR